MKDIKNMTLKEKVGQMIGLAFSGDKYSPELKMQVEDIEAGLIIYFKDNCITPKQIFELNKEINKNVNGIKKPFADLGKPVENRDTDKNEKTQEEKEEASGAESEEPVSDKEIQGIQETVKIYQEEC